MLGQVLKELRDARLLLVRVPPSCCLDVLHYGRPWGLSRWRLGQLLSSRDRAASNQGRHLWGRRCTAAPNARNRPTTHVPQPLLHLVRRLRASLASYGLRCGVANGAGPWRCAAGATLPPRGPGTGGLRRDRLPRSAVPPQWQATTRNRGNFRRHLRWLPRSPADGQQRAALRREGDGTRSPGLISRSRRMFSAAPAGSYPLVPARFTRVHFSSLLVP